MRKLLIAASLLAMIVPAQAEGNQDLAFALATCSGYAMHEFNFAAATEFEDLAFAEFFKLYSGTDAERARQAAKWTERMTSDARVWAVEQGSSFAGANCNLLKP